MKCSLCGKEVRLMQSHIGLKFIYKRIRRIFNVNILDENI